ncbi:MAG: hypothetical protein Q4A92_08015 [Corynebacterium sp.]|nr:hypothetical protein [Corynebacterium sp.]
MVLAWVDLPCDEFVVHFRRLCAVVNADDDLGVFLLSRARGDEFFRMVEESPWLEEVWSSEGEHHPVLDYFGFARGRFGVFEVVKPVGETFLVEEIFDDSRFDGYVLVVTDEPDFAHAVRDVFTDYLIYRGDYELATRRYLRGARSCLYSPGNLDEENIYDNQFGYFVTYSEEFVGMFPNSQPFL